MLQTSKSAPTNGKSCGTMMTLVPCKPERAEFADNWINMVQWACVKGAFADKVRPGKSDTFKEHRDAVTHLHFQKAFDNLSKRLLKK